MSTILIPVGTDKAILDSSVIDRFKQDVQNGFGADSTYNKPTTGTDGNLIGSNKLLVSWLINNKIPLISSTSGNDLNSLFTSGDSVDANSRGLITDQGINDYLSGKSTSLQSIPEADLMKLPQAVKTASGISTNTSYTSADASRNAAGDAAYQERLKAMGGTATSVGPTPPSVNLQPGDTGADVKKLQDYLVSQGLMTQAQVNTGYGTYGPQTTAAVQALQQKLGVDNSSGVGYFGPKTLSAIQSNSNANLATTGANTGSLGSLGPTGNQGGATGGIGAGITPTGNQGLDAATKSILDLANGIVSKGYTIPTTLQITPELIGTFLSWAHQNVDPQTQQLLSAEGANINASLKNLQTQHDLTRDNTVQQFGTDLASEQNTAGGNGVAFSGQRGLNERNLTATANRTLGLNDASTANSIGSALRTGAANVGSGNAGMFNLPTISTGSLSNLGGQRGSFDTNRTLDFGYNPSLYTAGNIPTAQNTALNNLQGNYLNQYSTLAGNNSNGSRSINDLLGMISGRPANAINNII